MPAIGMGLLWGGYTLILWGYTKLQGYDISITELVVPGKFKGKWPPPLIQDTDGDQKPRVPSEKQDPGQSHPGDKFYPPGTQNGGEPTVPA